MGSILSPEALARQATRHPWLIVGVWGVILVLAVFAASGLGDVLSTDQETYEKFEAARAEELIEEHLNGDAHPVQEYVVVQAQSARVDDPQFRRVALDLIERLGLDPTFVASVVNYYAVDDQSLVSQDRHTLLIPVGLRADASDSEQVLDAGGHVLEVVREAAAEAPEGYLLATGGEGSINTVFNEITERDLQTAELIGLPIALVVLVIVFGALVAAGMPVALGLLGIVVALGITAMIGRAYELSFFVTNMIFMIGLAVGIDYTLLVIQRFREERRRGLTRDSAIIKAGGTASRAVLFSGIAVIVSLAGLLIVPDSIFRSLSIGAIVVVVAAISASLTLLPALLRLLGDRVNIGRVRIPGRQQSAESGRFWNWAVRSVMRRPALMLVGAIALLLAAAAPYLRVELGFSGVETLPSDTEPGQAFAILGEEFSSGLLAPFQVVVEGRPGDPAVEARIDRLTELLAADGEFGSLTRTDASSGQIVLIETAVNADAQSGTALDALDRLRGDYIPAAFGAQSEAASVTGSTAYINDYADMINKWTPVVFTFVLGLSFLILLIVFRSIVVPIKAIIMNLLSVGAAYGIVVLVIQEGFGASLFGFTQVERIESWVPLFMFAILFGLSMDYHVFLLTRIRERFDETDDNTESVAYGVRATAGLITGAAAIMVAVFAGFAAGDMSMMQQFGFGLAIAITLDATIVRIILVPAAMALLGRANWYLPSWLEWLPRVDVDGVRDRHDHELVPVGPVVFPQGDPAA
jgi:RND superfamily putative drug exporter